MTKELEEKIRKLEQRINELEAEWGHLGHRYDIDTDRIITELVKLTGHPEYVFR